MKKNGTGFMILISVSVVLIFSIFVYAYRYWTDSKIYVIEDEAYLLSLMNESMPNGLYIEDPVWGMTYISDMNLVLDFYDFISQLPLSEETSESFENRETALKGIVYFTSGQYISFELGDYAVIDGIVRGTEYTRAELNAYGSLLKKTLYNCDNLANLITAQNKIQLRIGNDKKTLAMDQKRQLKELFLNGMPIQE